MISSVAGLGCGRLPVLLLQTLDEINDYGNTPQLVIIRSCGNGAAVLARMCGCENSGGDGNIILLFHHVFYCAQRHVLSKQRSRDESTLALVSETDRRRLPGHPDFLCGAVLQ